MTPFSRRRRQLLAGCALTACASPWAWAREWPSRHVELIVPWPAGGATDLTIRLLAEHCQTRLGQPVVIRNRPGAAGTLVAPALKQAEPDGHTIGQVPVTVYRHALMRPVDWNPLIDLQPIIQVSGTTFGLLVPADSPWRHPHELIEWARRHPGELKLGSTGVGSTPHLAMEDILAGLGIPYIHVPYKGTADQMIAIASGQLMAGVNSTGFAPWVEQGKMRVLAVFSERRSALWPDAPTMKEAGFPQAVYTSPWGFSAPRGTSPALIQRWHDLMREAIHAPAHVEALARYDQHLEYLNTQAYEQAILQTVERERRLLRRMNLLHTGDERPT